MPKIAVISLARISLRNIPKKYLIRVTNFVIFIAIFAISGAIISFSENCSKNKNIIKTKSVKYETMHSKWVKKRKIPKLLIFSKVGQNKISLLDKKQQNMKQKDLDE